MLDTAEEESWIDPDYDPAAYNGYDIRTSLGTASRTVRMAVGFSLFGDLLTEAERERVARAAVDKGVTEILRDWVLPGTRIHALDTMGHNFWCVIISAAALGTLVFRDFMEADGDALLRAAVDTLEVWFGYPGNPMNAKPPTSDRGGYYESVNYFDYSMREYLTFADAYRRMRNAHPFDDRAFMEDAARFYINHRADGKIVHRNCINVMDGIVTDAEILAVTEDGRYGVVNGSIVRKDGLSILEVLSRVDGWCDLFPPSMSKS